MSKRMLVATVGGVVLLAAAGYGLYVAGMNDGMKMASVAPDPRGATEAGRKVLYWHDPMYPGHKFDKPGKSPFMDMDLVPVYAEEGTDAGGVAISSRVQQNLGIRMAEATMGEVSRKIEAVGTVAWNERDVALVQARANGFVEKLHVRAQLDPVRKGQALAELYVPEWVAAQEEYLGARRIAGEGLDVLREGALQRMRLAGMDEAQVKLVETTGKVHARITLHSPIDGVVSELSAREGMTVMSGAPLFRINGLGTVWVNAEVPETLAGAVRPGNPVEAHAAAFPGRTFKGKVSAILPEVNQATRTLKARVELANPGGQLVPGMFATVDLAPAAHRQAVLVPTEAVIQTGKRTVVVVAEQGEDGKQRLLPVEVEVGAESGAMTEVRKGLEAGRKVVVSGQFLIDSEASLKAATSRLAEPTAAAPKHRGHGTVEAIGDKTITLSHGEIHTAKMGAMTMEFALASAKPPGVGPGTEVEFDLEITPQGEFRVTRVSPSPGTGHGGHPK
ncbi:MAG TPA: efflux RND transporter periplasmic adaptor subunit [Usitatibacter sp.]|nr:efflux RND transporter periplasmic adaptor subunit [Usitatibacter sp.]